MFIFHTCFQLLFISLFTNFWATKVYHICRAELWVCNHILSGPHQSLHPWLSRERHDFEHFYLYLGWLNFVTIFFFKKGHKCYVIETFALLKLSATFRHEAYVSWATHCLHHNGEGVFPPTPCVQCCPRGGQGQPFSPLGEPAFNSWRPSRFCFYSWLQGLHYDMAQIWGYFFP